MVTMRLRIINYINKHYYAIYVILLLFLGFLCFFNLGKAPVHNWDEARHAINAYEMDKSQNYIAHYYNGDIDYWNLKPIISYWCIIIFYKLFGYTVFSFRFYSALAYFLTILMISFFLKNQYGKTESIMGLILFLGCYQLLFTHMARTGDPDALFCFFCTIAMLSMLLWKKSIKLTWVSALAFSFAFLTKSWHAGIIIVVCGLFSILTGVIKKISLKNWIMIILCSLLPILIWGIVRYQFDGCEFFNHMFSDDLLKRSLQAIEGHENSFIYYGLVLKADFAFLTSILYIGIYSLEAIKERKKCGDDIIGLGLWVMIPILLFTFVPTKLSWYIFPSCIALILFGAIAIGKLFYCAKLELWKKSLILLGFLLISIGIVINAITIIRIHEDHKIQEFIKEAFIKVPFSDRDVYIQIDETDSWNPALLTCAKLYGNATCKDGGIEAYRRDSNARIVLLKEKGKAEYVQGKIIYENNKYRLLEN